MPSDPVVWIVLFALMALVVSLALWFGRGFVARWRDFRLEVKQPRAKPKGNIKVAEGADIERSEVGDIAGIKSEGDTTLPEAGQNIEVLEKGKVKDSKIGDITGIKQQGKGPKDK